MSFINFIDSLSAHLSSKLNIDKSEIKNHVIDFMTEPLKKEEESPDLLSLSKKDVVTSERLELKPVFKSDERTFKTTKEKVKNYIAYTDGSNDGNIGGWAYIIVENDKVILERKGRVPLEKSTNSTAELYAILKCLEENEKHNIHLYSDSQYCVKSFNEWIYKWINNGWRKSDGKPVEHQGYMKRIHELRDKRNVKFEHVRAHKDNKYNNLVDVLAKQGREMELILDNEN
jgi:ribonuclease HI